MSGNAEGLRVQCYTCGNWYDAEDVTIPLDGYIPFMTNYEYCCGSCGTETIVKKPASFIQVIITTLANLQASHIYHDPPETCFSLQDDIIPFVWDHWDMICTKRSKTGSWKNNLATKLATETRLFREEETGSQRFGLVDQDLSTIGPRRYESKAVPTRSVGRMKRRLDNSQVNSSATKRNKSDAPTSKGLSHGYPLEHPSNKDGYRYILAEKDPHAVLELDPEEMAGRPIPPELYRPAMATQVLLALHDRASQLRVGEDRLTVTGDKGYCMVRATHGVSSGTWFYEVYMADLDSVPECAVRLGWSQSLGNLQAPCGLDKLSYSWRSRFGTKFHQSRGKHYSESYATGDTLGLLIHLPNQKTQTSKLPPTHKDKVSAEWERYQR
ncbi:Set1/Ash2 histone methyltransferase complex subunit ASH2 [Geodia barretti]|uniref:Set1/Ash2 histone methyltransferase complex subunit ASH2 n=1 Tax=Geodia barretti TaxID=519541 RepID=A0AA35S6W3_GEOBA|nr:Set1/Ash2 histone methyltransferase complex subunit ASH2 [Geodia barretti]